jgi:hypothetical protein
LKLIFSAGTAGTAGTALCNLLKAYVFILYPVAANAVPVARVNGYTHLCNGYRLLLHIKGFINFVPAVPAVPAEK